MQFFNTEYKLKRGVIRSPPEKRKGKKMTQEQFITAVAKAIASNVVKGSCRRKLLEIALNGQAHTCDKMSKSYNDHTDAIIKIIEQIGIKAARRHIKTMGKELNEISLWDFEKGWYKINDAPRCGKTGTIIGINF